MSRENIYDKKKDPDATKNYRKSLLEIPISEEGLFMATPQDLDSDIPDYPKNKWRNRKR